MVNYGKSVFNCDTFVFQLIFSNEYTQAEGQNWHLKHFCCYDCDCVLAGETYVMEKDKPVCTTCYMKNYAMVSTSYKALAFFEPLLFCVEKAGCMHI